MMSFFFPLRCALLRSPKQNIYAYDDIDDVMRKIDENINAFEHSLNGKYIKMKPLSNLVVNKFKTRRSSDTFSRISNMMNTTASSPRESVISFESNNCRTSTQSSAFSNEYDKKYIKSFESLEIDVQDLISEDDKNNENDENIDENDFPHEQSRLFHTMIEQCTQEKIKAHA